MTDEQVERVARAIYETASGPWKFASDYGQDIVRREARAAIAALPPQDWQDIATAPKSPDLHNVVEIMAWCPSDNSDGGYRRVVWWEPKLKCWWSDRDIPEICTHWRPLPKPPAPPAAEIERTKGGG